MKQNPYTGQFASGALPDLVHIGGMMYRSFLIVSQALSLARPIFRDIFRRWRCSHLEIPKEQIAHLLRDLVIAFLQRTGFRRQADWALPLRKEKAALYICFPSSALSILPVLGGRAAHVFPEAAGEIVLGAERQLFRDLLDGQIR